MNNRIVFLNIENSKLQFYAEGFYFSDLSKFIPIDEPLDILLFVRGDKDANCVYFDVELERCSPEMEELRRPVTLRRLSEFISEEYHVEEFKFKMHDGTTVNQPMFDDLLFVGSPDLEIEKIILKSGLSEETLSFLKSHLGKFTQIDDAGKITILSEFSSLQGYLDFKYEKWNDECRKLFEEGLQ